MAGSHEGFARDGIAGLDDAALSAASTSSFANCWPPTWRCRPQAGADCVAIFDTAAGTLEPGEFARQAAPALAAVVREFRARCPHTPLIYYSRDTGPGALGGAARHRLAVPGYRLAARSGRGAAAQSERWGVQGNIDPQWLLLPPAELEARLRALFARVLALPAAQRAAWVCGLGHGVLQHTPEDNVRLVLQGAAGDVRVNARARPIR